MIGPDYTYLTNSYVEWLGLEPWLRPRPEPVYIDMPIAGGIKFLDVPMTAMDWVVVYNHALYFRSNDARSWERDLPREVRP